MDMLKVSERPESILVSQLTKTILETEEEGVAAESEERLNLDENGKPINEAGQASFDTARYQKFICTQLEIETCLEHKVGRGWLGNDRNRLRQAFLLDPPDGDRLDRKYSAVNEIQFLHTWAPPMPVWSLRLKCPKI